MKKRIIIALIILVIVTTVGLCLYFFVFKDKNMSTENAANLVNRIAIDIGAIADDENIPDLEELNVGAGNDTIIKSNPLPPIQEIDLTSGSLTPEKINEGTNDLKDLILLINSLLNTEQIESNKVYQQTVSDQTIKYFFKTIKNEITLTRKFIEGENVGIFYLSILYDSKDNEYEVIQTSKYNDASYSFKRYKLNSSEILSVESYELINLTNEDVETAIENGEGVSSIKISDFKNQTYKSIQLDKNISSDNHYVLSSYINQVYSNFNEKLGENIEIIDKETKPTVIDLLP